MQNETAQHKGYLAEEQDVIELPSARVELTPIGVEQIGPPDGLG